MKRIFTLFALSLVCVFCAIGFTACDNNMETGGNTPTEQASDNEKNNDRDNQNDDNDKHIHLYIETIINPTCTEQGYIKHICSICGDNYKDNYERALGHNYNEITTNPTCTERGYVTYTCERCADSYSTPFGNAAGHNYQSTIIAPTCTENGYTTHTCVECGDSYIDTYTNPTGHSYESKWTYDGEFHWHNSSCGHELIKDKETHTFNGTACSCGYDISNVLAFEKISGKNEYRVSEVLDNSMTSIVIPATYNECPVTKLDDALFYENNTIEKIIMANDIKTIGMYAFYNCSNLKEITLSDNITTIQDSLFYNCSKLIKLTIPNKVTSIGNGAFNGCSLLSELIIPDKVTSIGDNAFLGCSSLTSMTIPNSVMSIGSGALSGCSSLESVTIPFVGNRAGVTSEYSGTKYPFGYIFGTSNYTGGTRIAQYFDNGSENSGVYYLPSSLKTVIVTGGNLLKGAFDHCYFLTSIIIPDNITSIGSGAFRDCSSLTSITIPDSVTSIGYSAFAGCTGLTNITIPDSVTSIGEWAFACTSVSSITIPESVTSIKSAAFASCSSLKIVNWNAINCYVTINNSIGSQMSPFYNDIFTINIGKNVTSIIGSAFYACSTITEVNFMGTIDDWVQINFGSILSNPVNYSKNLFIDGEQVTEVNITNSDIINNYAFYNCSSLTSVNLSAIVTSIGNEAFYGCSSLKSIIIPENVTTVGENAFFGCIKLNDVTFNNTSGWEVSQYGDMRNSTAIIESDLLDTSQAATYLKSDYCSYYWKRSEQ
ncbi:MAG: leucine-rich repeat protein [Christensenellaceae bacterium]